jgi:hypothetical protein
VANYRRQARQAAKRYGLNRNIFERQIGAESGFDPNARSPVGARGIAQFMPDTARGLGINPDNPTEALDAAARLMAKQVKQYGGYENALRAYNAGPAAIEASKGYAETNAYVAKILGGANPSTGSVRPNGGGRNQGPMRVTGSGAGTQQTQVDTTPDMQALAVLGQTIDQAKAQPVPFAGLSLPDFAAKPTLPDGYQAPQVAAQQPQTGDFQALLRGIAASSAQGSQSTLTNQAAGQATANVQTGAPGGGGRLFYVGDSLGVGTSPDVQATGRNVKVGRSSAESVAVLRERVNNGFQGRVVFDAGTNDSSAHELAQSLKAAKALGVQLYVPTITGGSNVAAKNKVIRQLAGGNLHVVDTRSLSPDAGDAIHYTGAGYQKRAQLIQGAIGPMRVGPTQRQLQQAKGLASFDGKKVAAWIAPALRDARAAGVGFSLSSGWRSDQEQTRIYQSGVRPAALPQSLGGGGSNHEFKAFPGGAVDVDNTDGGATRLAAWLARSKYRKLLVYAGPKDPVHFSHPHGGSY